MAAWAEINEGLKDNQLIDQYMKRSKFFYTNQQEVSSDANLAISTLDFQLFSTIMFIVKL